MAIGRRRARKEALFLLYQCDLMGLTAPQVLERAELTGNLIDAYTRLLVVEVSRYRAALDEIIGRHLQGWTVQRLAPLERNIMRVALVEIGETGDVPVSVALDEAVGLAKRYCSDEAAALVNGVLAGAIAEIEAS